MVSTEGLVPIVASVRRRGEWHDVMVYARPESCLVVAMKLRAMLGRCWITMGSHGVYWRHVAPFTRKKERR